MVTVLNPKGFKLPRVEKEKFVLLIRLGLDYNRERGLYSLKNYNNIEKLIDTVCRYFKYRSGFPFKRALDAEKTSHVQTANTTSYAPPKICLLVASALNA